MAEAYRPGTKRNLKTQVNAYYEFCEVYGLKEFTTDRRQLTRFAVYLHKHKGLKLDTINNYLAGVRTLYALMEMLAPPTDTYLHKTVLRGIKARNKTPRKQAEAITPQALKAIYHHVDTSDLLELVAWVAVLIGFHCLLRASNLTTRSATTFNRDENLLRKDFRMHRNLLLVHIKWTKTLQYRERKLLIPVIPFADPDIDAVKWFQHMIAEIPAPETAPAFAVPTKSGFAPLTYAQLSKKLKRWAELAGFDPNTHTCHCLRRGGASWLDEQNVPDSVIAVLGDWRTNAFKSYIDSALNTRMRAMVMFANANNQKFD